MQSKYWYSRSAKKKNENEIKNKNEYRWFHFIGLTVPQVGLFMNEQCAEKCSLLQNLSPTVVVDVSIEFEVWTNLSFSGHQSDN